MILKIYRYTQTQEVENGEGKKTWSDVRAYYISSKYEESRNGT